MENHEENGMESATTDFAGQGTRRTWAPRGKTPVLRHNFNRKRLSICPVIGYRWDGTQSRLFFRIVSNSYNDVNFIDLLVQLRKEFRHKRVILLWDGLPSHRS